MHPLGLAPILVDDDITIAESGAIVRKKPLVWSCLARMLTEYGIQSTCSESTANSGRRSQNQLKSMISTVRLSCPRFSLAKAEMLTSELPV